MPSDYKLDRSVRRTAGFLSYLIKKEEVDIYGGFNRTESPVNTWNISIPSECWILRLRRVRRNGRHAHLYQSRSLLPVHQQPRKLIQKRKIPDGI